MDVRKAALSIPAEEAERHPRAVVWHLAWPVVALNSFQVVNNVLDRGFLGRLSAAAIAGQSASMNVTFFMFSCIMALATAPGAIVSRAFGAKDMDEVQTATRKCLSISLLFGIFLGGLTALVAYPAALALLPKDDHAAVAYMTHYLRVYALAIPALSVINNLAAALRGIGDTRSPMVLSGIQIALHIILNVLLIFPTRSVEILHLSLSLRGHSIHFGPLATITMPGAGMGLIGAATALTISAWVSAAIYLIYSGRTPVGAAWKFGLVAWSWVWRILRIAAPATLNGVIRVLSMSVFTYILAHTVEGSSAISAMALGFAIESIMFMPSFGISMAAAALVGQSLGMKDPDRAERLGWMAAHMAGLITLVLCIPLAVFAHPIAAVMSPGKDAIIHQTALLIQWVCATEVAFAYFGVTVGAMQGAGDTVRPIWITIGTMWVLRIPLAMALALQTASTYRVAFGIPWTDRVFDTGPFTVGLGIGALGAWIAMSASQLAQGALAVALFKRGAWKLRDV